MDGLILIGIGLILIFLSKVLKENDKTNSDEIVKAYNRGYDEGYRKAKEEMLEDSIDE